ncbi:helix-turn-helix transcriptional regulator [Sinomonas sp. ASV322]|uniref:helix-turn-helix transcriptional regulator n=1 Tax=Sinomonas sp. ASV322 TaxID=3041920 RepID=UPI0027DBAF9A|nr:helix-turn-helix transcriptional regulator [Sinomonas sp. ASV322]MDQ4504039.1 helix-turn-helix transcriptional regulator [Sinomonas sp. ASV322]
MEAVKTSDGSSSSSQRHRRLGEFLRSKRGLLSPEDLGLPRSARRRTPGLRREEVAVMANVGVSWYTWLEQGRAIGASDDVLEAIADVLRLDDDERRYMHRLSRRPPRAEFPVDAERARLEALIEVTAAPAYAADPYWRVVAANRLARECFDAKVGESCLERFFLEPGVAGRYVHRELMGRSLVEQFRAQTARYPDDREFDEMAARLRAGSSLFREYWDRHMVGETYRVDIVFEHETLGMLSFEPVSMSQGDSPLRLYTYLPRAGTRTAAQLERWLSASSDDIRGRTAHGAG